MNKEGVVIFYSSTRVKEWKKPAEPGEEKEKEGMNSETRVKEGKGKNRERVNEWKKENE